MKVQISKTIYTITETSTEYGVQHILKSGKLTKVLHRSPNSNDWFLTGNANGCNWRVAMPKKVHPVFIEDGDKLAEQFFSSVNK